MSYHTATAPSPPHRMCTPRVFPAGRSEPLAHIWSAWEFKDGEPFPIHLDVAIAPSGRIRPTADLQCRPSILCTSVMCSRYLFATLVLLHVGGFLFPPDGLAPLIANSVYLPLTLLKMIGLPVYDSAEAWGWASPSTLGWAAVTMIWGLIWWWVAKLATWGFRRRAAATQGADGI